MGKWKTLTLGEVNQYEGKSINPLNSPDTTYELYSVPSWDNNYPEIVQGKEIGSTKQSVNKNDVLLCKINPRINRVWTVDQYTENQLIASSEWIIIRNEQMSSEFLYYYLQSPKFRDLLVSEQSGIGGSLTRAQPKRVAMYPVPIPPLDVQQKIADVLDKASALIELRKAQLDKLDLLIKSQFIEMFGDPVTNPKGWPIKPLSDFTQFLTSGSRGWARYFTDEGEMFLTIKNVKKSRISTDNVQYIHAPNGQESTRTKVQEGDLLISITADLGRTGVVTKEIADYGAYINQHLSLIRLDKSHINPLYVSYFLESEAGRRQFDNKNQTGVKAGLNFNAIKSLQLLVPPVQQQNDYLTFVQQVDKSKSALQQSLEKLELNYKSLMQKCFRGEIF